MIIARKYGLMAIVVGFGVLAGIPPHASAQIQRSDNMRVIVAFAAGGVVDQIARIVGQAMSEQLGTAVIIDNRGGAGGELAMQAVATAAPDGKTILFHTSSLVLTAALKRTVKETAAAFEPLARVGAVKFVFVVRKDVPAKTIADLVKLSDAGTALNYGSTGHGTALHIAGEMLKNATGIKAVHVPYRGLSPLFQDLVGGRTDFVITSVGGVLPYVKAGTVRAIATFDSERSEQLPDVPTTVELGFKQLTYSNWFGFFAPAAVPQNTRSQLEEVLLKVLRSQMMQTKLHASGLYGVLNAAQFKQAVDREFSDLSALLERMNIRPDN